MGAGKTVAGVILLAIGLLMVIFGGAVAVDPLLNPYTQGYGSNTLVWYFSIGIFWIGMIPTIVGVRFIAQPSTIREIEDRIDSLMKTNDDAMRIKNDFQKQLDSLRHDLDEEIKKH